MSIESISAACVHEGGYPVRFHRPEDVEEMQEVYEQYRALGDEVWAAVDAPPMTVKEFAQALAMYDFVLLCERQVPGPSPTPEMEILGNVNVRLKESMTGGPEPLVSSIIIPKIADSWAVCAPIALDKDADTFLKTFASLGFCLCMYLRDDLGRKSITLNLHPEEPLTKNKAFPVDIVKPVEIKDGEGNVLYHQHSYPLDFAIDWCSRMLQGKVTLGS